MLLLLAKLNKDDSWLLFIVSLSQSVSNLFLIVLTDPSSCWKVRGGCWSLACGWSLLSPDFFSLGEADISTNLPVLTFEDLPKAFLLCSTVWWTRNGPNGVFFRLEDGFCAVFSAGEITK